MIGIYSLRSRFLNILLIVVWFFVWGLCPWNNDSALAQTSKAVHATHGHQGMDDTHHASKGVEHSCSGSASLSNEESTREKGSVELSPQNDFPVSIIALSRFYHPFHLPLRLLQARAFSKRFSSLYQTNQSLRL